MATKKKTTEKRALTTKEKDKFFELLGKARVYARKMSLSETKRADVKQAFRSIEKKLWNIGNDYRWGSLTDYR